MCEATSSGLLQITSNNIDFPEFVTSKSLFLTDNSIEKFLKAIMKILKKRKS